MMKHTDTRVWAGDHDGDPLVIIVTGDRADFGAQGAVRPGKLYSPWEGALDIPNPASVRTRKHVTGGWSLTRHLPRTSN